MIGIEGESGFQRVDGTPVPDTALSTTSTNSVQNKVVTEALGEKIVYVDKSLSLNDLTFTASYSGMFISGEVDLSDIIASGYTIAAISITSWTRFRTTDYVNAFISDARKIKVYSNVNSFVSTASIAFRLLCIK